jgi:hypothetical protein
MLNDTCHSAADALLLYHNCTAATVLLLLLPYCCTAVLQVSEEELINVFADMDVQHVTLPEGQVSHVTLPHGVTLPLMLCPTPRLPSRPLLYFTLH